MSISVTELSGGNVILSYVNNIIGRFFSFLLLKLKNEIIQDSNVKYVIKERYEF